MSVRIESYLSFTSLTCDDGYKTSLPISDLLEDKVLLAYKLNDKPLPPERGGPLCLVVPQKYAYKGAMWLRKIKFASIRELGYWGPEGIATLPIHGKRKDTRNNTFSHPLMFVD